MLCIHFLEPPAKQPYDNAACLHLNKVGTVVTFQFTKFIVIHVIIGCHFLLLGVDSALSILWFTAPVHKYFEKGMIKCCTPQTSVFFY
jgi:predicted PurR-regulated permease PerM